MANLLRLWSLKAKLANMHVERLLALIKASVSSNRPTCEKLLAGGLLSPVLRDHVAAGGRDPRVVLRDELIKDGMPLESAQRRPTVSPQMARGSLAYQNHKAAERKVQNPVQRTQVAELRQLRRGWAEEYRQMSDAEQERWGNTSYAEAQGKVAAAERSDSGVNPSGLSLQDVNFGVGVGDLPISEEVAIRIARDVIGREPGGFSSYRTQFKDKLRDDMFVRDKGALSV